MRIKTTTKTEYQQRINVLVEYINNHLGEDIDLNKLAEISGFSRWHFHRIFAEFLGEPVGTFIVRMRLLQFAKEQNIQPLSFSPICLYHDDPKVTSPDKLLTDICLEVAPSVCPKGEIGTKQVLEGRFMVALYKGTYQQLGAVYDTLYGKYLPEMGLSLREVPSGEIYLNDPRNTKPEDLLTQIYVAIE